MKTIKLTMKTIKLIALIALFIGFASCDSDDEPIVLEVESKKIENLHAPQIGSAAPNTPPISGPFTKFNFATGEITTSDTDWDIAFRGTSIVINGGASSTAVDEPNRTGEGAAYVASGTMATITEVNTSLLMQDASDGYAIPTGSGNGWYTYNPQNYTISPIAGKILVIKTHDGKYAKVEILSYYKDKDVTKESRYYTFNYVYQPNAGVTTF